MTAYHSLSEYCNLLGAPVPHGLGETPITLVSYDSRQVVAGTLFVCKGAHFKVDFLHQAEGQGAVCYVSETAYEGVNIPCILVEDLRLALAPIANLYYGAPSQKLDVVGITGTKGKSTTTYYMKYILDAHQGGEDRGCGVISTIATYDGVERFPSRLTTPEPFELQRHFANCLTAGLPYATMEVSSQALKYHRTLGTHFQVACFLNIGYDHISPVEHPDFEDYFASKLKIFAQAEVACVNLDSDHSDAVLAAAREGCTEVITFSCRDSGADIFAQNIRREGEGMAFYVRTPHFAGEMTLRMLGAFNVENALGAIAIATALGVSQQAITDGLAVARVPGRMEVYSSEDKNIVAIVDYAHNGMSLQTLFSSVQREYPGRPIVSIFGCPGGKAYDRRREMGEIAGRNARLTVLTEDDSGEENTADICREIATHVAAVGGKYTILENRGEAIRQAIMGCEEPIILLVAGKGHEARQKRGLQCVETIPDSNYVQTFLGEYDAICRHGRERAHIQWGLE